MNPKSILCVSVALLSLCRVSHCLGQGTEFTYQGRLSNGTHPTTGVYDLRFGIFDASTEGNQISEPITKSGVDVVNGLFSATLDFGRSVFTGPNRWLEISVRASGEPSFTTLLPRQPMTPAPYSITAGNLSGPLNASQLTGALPSSALAGTYYDALNFNNESNHYAGDGTALKFGGVGYCALPCYWNLNGNAGTTPGLNFIGTTDNATLEFRVNGHRALRLEPTTNSPNIIGGFEGNVVEDGGEGNAIGGGGSADAPNRILVGDYYPLFSTIVGGAGNRIIGGHFATIAGGSANLIEVYRPLAREYDTIGGGFANSIRSGGGSTIAGGTGNSMLGDGGNWVRYCVIGGGINNFISSDFIETTHASTIAGGQGNQIYRTSYATIVGGFGNLIQFYADGATIAGGFTNFIGNYSTLAFIGGGRNNNIGHDCQESVIAGGNGNSITGAFRNVTAFATVSGGQSNRVTGVYGTVAGGRLNVAADSAFAAGTRAKAIHSGAFVWASGNTNDYPSSSSNRVHFYAAGGMEVAFGGQDVDGHGLKWLELASQEPGRVINAYNGAYLSEGGAWTDTSDRNAKENFEPVDPHEILERVIALPLNRWNYRSESNAVRHLGPVAQDFHAAFGVGADDKHIAGLDSSGVALAAIQGLSHELRAKQAEINLLKQRLEALESRLDRLMLQRK
jgi:hypothetical protein